VSKVLIKNGYVVTVDGSRRVWPKGFVTTDGAKIAALGPMDACPSDQGFDDVIDAAGCVVMPGLINTHQHHWYTLFKGLADGYLLEDWVAGLMLPLARQLTPEAMKISGHVAALEMLATGTTCSFNHSVTTTTADHVRATIESHQEVGIRQVFAKELRCNTPGNPTHPLSLDEALGDFDDEVKRWDGFDDGRVRMAMVIESNAHWVAAGMSTEDLIVRGYQFAKSHNLQISAHIAGGTFSLEKGFLKYLRETGRTDVRYLMQLGVLDPHWLMIHGIHCTELDIQHMAEVGAHYVYTPTSESIRGGGIGPFANAIKAGVNCALGTDGPMVDYSVDMVEQMKGCTLMQHVRHLDPTRMPAERSIEMATINGARALRLDHEIGSLEVGKRADIAVFDLTGPHVGVVHRPISSLVFAGKGTDAKYVLVNGDVCLRDGAFPRFADAGAAVAEAKTLAAGVLEKAGLSHRLDNDWRA
jgi:5-methylthioadenosine/S-adenosylhomocysteine deaminase